MSPPRAPAPGLRTLATAGLAIAATTVATTAVAMLWRGASKRIGAAGVGPAGLHLHATSARPPAVDEAVSVLIPVRHDPDPAVTAVRAALGQRGVGHLDIVVLDDGCPQETRAALRREFGDDPRVRILAAAPLPRGWSPRAHRSHQLAVAARGRVLIFTEPSAPLGPHAAASVTALLRAEHLDLAVLDTGKPAEAATTNTSSEGDSRRDDGSELRGGDGDRQDDDGRSGSNRTHGGGAQDSQVQLDGDQRRRGPVHDGQAHGGRAPNGQTNGQAHSEKSHGHGVWPHGVWPHGVWPHSNRVHPGRFTVAVDADAYWRTGGYRTAADDPDPLALLRMLRRASGRVAVADGRSVIPPAQLVAPLPPADPQAEAEWDSLHSSRLSLSETARRVLAALVLGARS